MNLRFLIVLLLACFAVAGIGWAGPEGDLVAEPKPRHGKITRGTYGDEEVVGLLAKLLDDPDTITRVWAVENLGQTHNSTAIEHLRRALKDQKHIVRAGAVSAAAEVGFAEANDMILSSLSSEEPDMLFTAMRAVQSLDLSEAVGSLRKLMHFGDPAVRAMAAKTLTHLEVACNQADLEKLLMDKSAGVRLAAMENASLLDQAEQVTDELILNAEQVSLPGVRSRSLELLGRFAFSSAESVVSTAASDANPLVRRGAVRAYHQARKGRQCAAFLDDPSAMVRLAAIKATGDMKIAAQTEKLFKLLFDAKDDMTRQAAREALAKIGTEQVVAVAAKALPEWAEMPAPGPGGKRSAEQIQANTVSCCWLLGRMKSTVALDYQLALLAKRDVVSLTLLTEAPALAEMGDPRAIEPLKALLDRCGRRARSWLNAYTSGRSTPPYEPEISRSVMLAIGALNGHSGVDSIMATAKYKSKGQRLSSWGTAAIEVLPGLITDGNRKAIEQFVIAAIPPESGYELTPRFHSVKTAVKMKLEGAVPAIESILEDERPGWTMIHTAAWALQELTGQTPDMPKPRLRQGRDWVVRKIVD